MNNTSGNYDLNPQPGADTFYSLLTKNYIKVNIPEPVQNINNSLNKLNSTLVKLYKDVKEDKISDNDYGIQINDIKTNLEDIKKYFNENKSNLSQYYKNEISSSINKTSKNIDSVEREYYKNAYIKEFDINPKDYTLIYFLDHMESKVKDKQGFDTLNQVQDYLFVHGIKLNNEQKYDLSLNIRLFKLRTEDPSVNILTYLRDRNIISEKFYIEQMKYIEKDWELRLGFLKKDLENPSNNQKTTDSEIKGSELSFNQQKDSIISNIDRVRKLMERLKGIVEIDLNQTDKNSEFNAVFNIARKEIRDGIAKVNGFENKVKTSKLSQDKKDSLIEFKVEAKKLLSVCSGLYNKYLTNYVRAYKSQNNDKNKVDKKLHHKKVKNPIKRLFQRLNKDKTK